MADAPEVTILVDQLRRRPLSGIGTYVRGLLQGLRELDGDAPPLVLGASRAPGGADPLARLGFAVRTSALPGPVMARAWVRGLEDRGPLARWLRSAQVIHATSLAAPYPGRPVTVTVHDVAWKEVPDTFPARGRDWHERAFRRCVGHAAAVIVPSERTAELVRAAAGPNLELRVVPHGGDHLPVADTAGGRALLAALGVRTPYLLSVSTLEPRKNLVRLVTAYGRARPSLPEPWPLVVVGPHGWGRGPAPVPGVVFAGAVADGVLSALYAGARCLAYVPLVEGWGLPPLEAMGACVPVVASPMPSTSGAALEVDPLDVEAIAAALVVAAGEDRRRSALVTAGLERFGELTWARSARAHVELWEGLR